MIAIVFNEHSIVHGSNATEALQELCGWFNPETVPELRKAFMRRAGCAHMIELESLTDEAFVQRMAESDIGFWSVNSFEKSDLPVFASKLA
jgi:hypothetical protein